MPSLLDQALGNLGVSSGTNGALGVGLGVAANVVPDFNKFGKDNNGQPTSGVEGQLANLINSQIPPIFRTNPSPAGLKVKPKAGEWEALHYANDLVAHHPKFKFIFKVKFEGFDEFGNSDFFYYVHKVDKPNITFEHMDVNYYNFRSKVLTRTIFQPMSITFLDEIGNSVNDFFVKYLKATTSQGSGGYGIDSGFGSASSTKPYKRGSSNGKAIIVNQIFANGLYTNQYRFVNPRIESFQFDELNMEDNAGSLVTMQFTYDSLVCDTFSVGEDNDSALYTWGNTDVLKGGGTSGLPNAGATSLNTGGKQQAQAAGGGSQIAGFGLSKFTGTNAIVTEAGVSQLNSLPNSLKDMAAPGSVAALEPLGQLPLPGQSTVDRNTSDTLASIQNGSNFASITRDGGLSSLSAPPGDGGVTVLQPGDPLPRNNDAYQRYLSITAADSAIVSQVNSPAQVSLTNPLAVNSPPANSPFRPISGFQLTSLTGP